MKPPLLRDEDPYFKNKIMTFDQLHKMDYKPFTGKGSKHDFNPSDFLHIDDSDSENEVLTKYKSNK